MLLFGLVLSDFKKNWGTENVNYSIFLDELVYSSIIILCPPVCTKMTNYDEHCSTKSGLKVHSLGLNDLASKD